MGNHISERRGADRYSINRELRYRMIKPEGAGEASGGHTVNMSSKGVLFTTNRPLLPGERLELSISWTAAASLIARGSVVRAEPGRAAVEIEHCEFRTTPAS